MAHLVRNEKDMFKSLIMLAYLKGIKEFLGDGRTLPCSAASESVFIGVGDVFPCIVMNHKVGNAYETPLKEILASEETSKICEVISELQCPTCGWSARYTGILERTGAVFWTPTVGF